MNMLTMRQLMYASIEMMASLPATDPETDPLRVNDMLDECELMDVLIDVRREYVGVLFYAAGSLYQKIGNAYLVVARGLKDAHWFDPMGTKPGKIETHLIGGSYVRDLKLIYTII